MLSFLTGAGKIMCEKQSEMLGIKSARSLFVRKKEARKGSTKADFSIASGGYHLRVVTTRVRVGFDGRLNSSASKADEVGSISHANYGTDESHSGIH